ncbi:MAG: hypothetical protein SGI91_21045 [Alphaproteobacteria bacterium]|nr:hypothetical protein [Alphaproteobacteria bacterium]
MTVTIDREAFVRFEDILILEFAAEVERWLSTANGGAGATFYYSSMDEEEEPLLAFVGDGSGRYVLKSCWSSVEARPVSHDEVVEAFSVFIAGLSDELIRKHQFRLADALRQAT